MTQVAQTIRQQLGGQRFVAMTGARQFVGSDKALHFSLPAGTARDRINHVRIELTADDLYCVTFSNYRAFTLRTVREVEGVYADKLQATFTAQTGLDTHL